MREKSSPKFALGITDTETVMLDFDDTSFSEVLYWARRAMRWFRLEGFLILKSSENNYHVVFSRPVSWAENMRVVAWVALMSHCKGLQRWHLMQCIKQGSTLRLSPKGGNPSPRIVYKFGKQDKKILDFLSFRRHTKEIIRKISMKDGLIGI